MGKAVAAEALDGQDEGGAVDALRIVSGVRLNGDGAATLHAALGIGEVRVVQVRMQPTRLWQSVRVLGQEARHLAPYLEGGRSALSLAGALPQAEQHAANGMFTRPAGERIAVCISAARSGPSRQLLLDGLHHLLFAHRGGQLAHEQGLHLWHD